MYSSRLVGTCFVSRLVTFPVYQLCLERMNPAKRDSNYPYLTCSVECWNAQAPAVHRYLHIDFHGPNEITVRCSRSCALMLAEVLVSPTPPLIDCSSHSPRSVESTHPTPPQDITILHASTRTSYPMSRVGSYLQQQTSARQGSLPPR